MKKEHEDNNDNKEIMETACDQCDKCGWETKSEENRINSIRIRYLDCKGEFSCTGSNIEGFLLTEKDGTKKATFTIMKYDLDATIKALENLRRDAGCENCDGPDDSVLN